MDTLSLFFGLLFLLPASIIDFRTREVPDLLSYGLILFGVAYGVAKAILLVSWVPLAQMGVGLAVMASLGCLLYYTGQWGGADTKLLMGVGALLGLGLGTLDALLFLIFTLLAGAAYGVLYSLGLLLRHRKRFLPVFKKLLREKTRLRSVVVIGCFAILALLFFSPEWARPLLIIMTIAIYALFYLWLITKAVEKALLIKRYPVRRLTEGDWIQEAVRVKGRVIAGPKDLGVTNEQIAKLKRLKVQSVLVKEGIPFVPSFLLGYALLYLLGPLLVQALPFL